MQSNVAIHSLAATAWATKWSLSKKKKQRKKTWGKKVHQRTDILIMALCFWTCWLFSMFLWGNCRSTGREKNLPCKSPQRLQFCCHFSSIKELIKNRGVTNTLPHETLGADLHVVCKLVLPLHLKPKDMLKVSGSERIHGMKQHSQVKRGKNRIYICICCNVSAVFWINTIYINIIPLGIYYCPAV